MNETATDAATKGQPATATASATTSEDQQAVSIDQPLRSEVVLSTSRAATHASRELDDEENRELQLQLLRAALRNLPYAEYLQHPWWRSRRNRALRLAGYRCQKCDARRELQVHHVSYERLGFEHDDDLEVLCRACHEGHHFRDEHHGLSVYMRLISAVLSDDVYSHFSDIVEEVKCRCVRLQIDYRTEQLHEAIARMSSRFPKPNSAAPAEVLEHQPLTRDEARSALKQLGALGLLKAMKPARALTLRDAELKKASRIVAAEIVESIQRCEDAESAIAWTAEEPGA